MVPHAIAPNRAATCQPGLSAVLTPTIITDCQPDNSQSLDRNNISRPPGTLGDHENIELEIEKTLVFSSIDPADMPINWPAPRVTENKRLADSPAETQEGHRGVAIAHYCKACKSLIPAVSTSKNRETHEHWRVCPALAPEDALERVRALCEQRNKRAGRLSFHIPSHTTRDIVKIVNYSDYEKINSRYRPIDRGKT